MKYELNQVYNMDCMIGMAQIPDKYFELAIVDPPYGIGDFSMKDGSGKKYEDHKIWRYDWNNDIPSDAYFEELIRVSTHRILWGANYYNRFEKGAIVWYKHTAHPSMSKCEIASCTQHKRVNYVNILWQNVTKENQQARTHPCQKPIALYKWLLSNYANEGDKILDTHVGSGSSIIACIDMGFDYMGFEIDADYYKAMQDRIYHFTRQTSLI